LNANTLPNHGFVATNPYKILVEDIHQIHNSRGEVTWNHIFMEANQTTYDHAKHCLILDIGVKIFKFLNSVFYSKYLFG